MTEPVDNLNDRVAVSVPERPAYDVREVSPPGSPDEKVLLKMSLTSAAANLVTLAEGAEHGGNHASLSPYLTGIGAFVALMLLLWITTRFNRDR
ncbi:hypothetical protein [Streptomyces zhihengii]|uniref:Uncharacterized protein n=1 Tax=Streptomyces zhihengii TaxID=1818004 RepID=A0ABS2UVX6_9ACTN|nr:hypothetical protein [Streptomyces zhihengii]MBM9621634.1 hypothetical protein [Streptomyces zhihengii]